MSISIVAVLTAFAGGLVSFLSPCVLPLVPGYLSIISGYSLDQLKGNTRDAALKRSVVINSMMFIVGFSITFIALGATPTALGQVLRERMQILYRIAGLVIIIFGLHVLGIFKINALYQDKRFHDVEKPRGGWGVLLFGLVFAFGWTPCIGPILAGILGIAASQETVTRGIILLAVYSLGLGVPFLLTSLGLNQFLAFYGRFKRHFRTLEIVSGVMVVAIGLMIVTGSLTRLSSTFGFLNNFETWLESFLPKT
jgi:cytochrome c-type biogenesis protein